MDLYQAEYDAITRIDKAFYAGKPFRLFEFVYELMEEYDLVEGEAQIIYYKVTRLYTRLDFLKEAKKRDKDPESLLEEKVKEMIHKGECKINCVKYMRERLDWGLRECSLRYDAFVDKEAVRRQSEERLNKIKGDIDSLEAAMLELVQDNNILKEAVKTLFLKHKELTQ